MSSTPSFLPTLSRTAAVRRMNRRATSERRWSLITLWTGGAIVGLIALLAAAAPLLGLPDPERQDLLHALEAPSWQHPFGTDTLGRDMLSRVIYGARVDLLFAVVATGASLVLGVLVGALAGYAGGWVDTVVNRLVDVVVAFPFIVLVLAIVAIFGPGLSGAYVGVLVVGWALYARVARGEMLVVREKEYMLAARTLGFSRRRILLRHGLPNAVRSSMVFSMSDIVLNILLLSALSFLGLGVAPPTPEWGALVADGRDVLLTAWWVATLPGAVIVLAGVGFSLLGDGLADRLDPKVSG